MTEADLIIVLWADLRPLVTVLQYKSGKKASMPEAVRSLTQFYDRECQKATNEKFENVMKIFGCLVALMSVKLLEEGFLATKACEIVDDQLFVRLDKNLWERLIPGISKGVENLRHFKNSYILTTN
jgi:hypothetical protein